MNKRTRYRILSIISALLALLMIVCAVTVTGRGFLDLSNIIRSFFIAMAIVCAILALAFYLKDR